MIRFDPLAVPLTGTQLIEASAGTGKTHAIADLYVRLLIEHDRTPGEILVVTYTNAATAELRRRVRTRVQEALAAYAAGDGSGDPFLEGLVERRRADGKLPTDHARLLNALHSFDEAAIFTIHGFCQRVLHENAFESGVAFDTELLADERPLLVEVVRDFWVRTLHDVPLPVLQMLLSEKIQLPALEALAAKAVATPDMPVLPRPDNSPRQDRGTPATVDVTADPLRLRLALIEYARREMRRRKVHAGLQSFDDMLHRLAAGLRGPHGTTLAAMIRRRFPAALIDEFQDTDPVQYDIFRHVADGTGTTLFLIGDPKQAIYAFRGADVFAYLRAKRDAGDRQSTLDLNRRSDPSLVQALNVLFERPRNAFVLDGIDFNASRTPRDAIDHLSGAGTPPLQILFVCRTGQESKKGNAINKGWAETVLADAIAAEIVRLLDSGVTIDGQRVAPKDIAVLCRTNKQASLMQVALRSLGVPTVLQTEASVFETPEAEEVERVLRALADPIDARAIRAALSTTLLGLDAQNLWQLEQTEGLWDEWMERFRAWHERWTQRGFVAAFRALLDAQSVMPRLLALFDGERRVTNVLHLLELLHTACTEHRLGPNTLTRWLNDMRNDVEARAAVASEAAQIRLESDAHAVKLTTVHKSKGLQYPIVYCPYLWEGARLSAADKAAVRFHDSANDNRLTLDIGSAEHAAHLAAADREGFAESVRLLYVALTRARHHCSVVWGAFRDADSSALGYLLHQPAATGGDLRAATAERIKTFIKERDDEGMCADLRTLAREANGSINIGNLSIGHGERYTPRDEPVGPLRLPATTRSLDRSWRVSSFSALASATGALSQPAEEGLDHDAAAEGVGTGPGQGVAAGELITLHDFPSGARAGQLVHEILEAIDFRNDDPNVLRAQAGASVERFGFDARWVGPLARAIDEVLSTPLDDGVPPLRLRDVARAKSLREMEFIYPVATESGGSAFGHSAGAAGSRLTPSALAAVFARYGSPALRSYTDRLRELSFAPFRGYLRGFIDLAFEHDGLWYVVDYKSNLLGASPAAYRPDLLQMVMAEHHYVLQYHLYVVALHRHLKARLPDYDYDRHFGGVYYLFVRGMAPTYAFRNGIVVDRPSRPLVEELSDLLANAGKDA